MGYLDFSRLALLNIFAYKCKQMFIEHLLGASPVKIKYDDGKGNRGLALRDFGYKCGHSHFYWVHASSSTSLIVWVNCIVGLSGLSLEGFPPVLNISCDRIRQTFSRHLFDAFISATSKPVSSVFFNGRRGCCHGGRSWTGEVGAKWVEQLCF